MSVNHLDILHSELPELFQPHDLPEAWDDDFIIVRIDDPEWLGLETGKIDSLLETDELPLVERDDLELPLFTGLEESDLRDDTNVPAPVPSYPELLDVFGGIHPGALISRPDPRATPPPDCLAFYLPFHYYHPTWWGVYLLYEGVLWLAEEISRRSGGVVSRVDAVRAARLFLYYHEAFHHKTECFATRLELTHRRPLYRTDFERFFQSTFQTDACLEEGLANATALKETNNLMTNPTLDRALQAYVADCPPGYRQGQKIRRRFAGVRSRFAEENQHACFPSNPKKNPAIWQTAPQLFTGVANIKARVNYLIPRTSPLVARMPFRPLLPASKLVKKLKDLAGLEFVRSGGNHDIYRTRTGKMIPIPRHPGDLGRGLIRSILKEAGLEMSLEQFMQA